MYTSYAIEKVAESSRREALAAAEQRRLAREVRRPQQDTATTAPSGIRIARPRRWLGLAWHGTALSGR
jgi:hypothetical protein